ncbi:MAG: helix-turn-helix transcriptional regulator [Flavobacteriales bacterium]|nr:helix-turn-helix transcriptional regulator [Flavobacteriales bacterium]
MAYKGPAGMENGACLTYVLEGERELYSATEKFILKGKESILMKCGNFILNAEDASPTNPYKSLGFHVSPDMIKKAFGNRSLDFLKVKRRADFKKTALKQGENVLMESFIVSMMSYFEHPELVNDDLLAAKLQELVLIVCDGGKNELANQIFGTLYTPTELLFEEVIEANLYHNLSIPDLAELTNRSESSFKRDFKKWYGESPAKWFKTKKLEYASELLKTTDLSISEICWDCGFESPAHFSTSFHNKYGKSPKPYQADLN